MKLKHELWEENEGQELTFCLAGRHGDDARKLLSPDAKLIWTVEAESHFEAMTAYYKFMAWGETQPIRNGTCIRIQRRCPFQIQLLEDGLTWAFGRSPLGSGDGRVAGPTKLPLTVSGAGGQLTVFPDSAFLQVAS